MQLFTPKKEQDAVGIIYSFLGLVKRSTNEPIQTSYSRAKIPYLSMFKQGMTQSFIADNIGVNKTTISRELARNTGKRSYRYKQAQMFARYRQSVPKYQKWNNDIQRQVNRKLCLQWSPEQTSGWLKIKQNISISHERIYQYILQDKKSGGSLWTHLRHANKKRKKRYGKADRRGIIPNKVMIVERPSVVDEKTRIGDFELDTIIGKGHKGAVVTIVDRKSKLLLAKPVKRRTAALVSEAIIQLLKPYINHTHTLTPDNGKEFFLSSTHRQTTQYKSLLCQPVFIMGTRFE